MEFWTAPSDPAIEPVPPVEPHRIRTWHSAWFAATLMVTFGSLGLLTLPMLAAWLIAAVIVAGKNSSRAKRWHDEQVAYTVALARHREWKQS